MNGTNGCEAAIFSGQSPRKNVEPYIASTKEALHVDIPAADKRFRVQTLSPTGTPIGTTVRVHVLGGKLPRDQENHEIQRLNATDYLQAVAGYVEFPILINEDSTRTAIVRPETDLDALRRRIKDFADYQVVSLSLEYPWDDAFWPQDVPAARTVFREETFDLKRDLVLEGYEGTLKFVVPARDHNVIADSVHDVRSFDPSGSRAHRDRIRLGPDIEMPRRFPPTLNHVRSANRRRLCGLYRDGVLMAQESRRSLRRSSEVTPDPLLLANVQLRSSRVDVSRSVILNETASWTQQIWNAFLERIAADVFPQIVSLPPKDRLGQLARLTYYGIKIEELWKRFPQDCWPVALLHAGGRVSIADFSELTSNCPPTTPRRFDIDVFDRKKDDTDDPEGRSGGRLQDFSQFPHPCVVMNVWRAHSYGYTNAVRDILTHLQQWLDS